MAGALTELLVEDCGVGEMRRLSRALWESTAPSIPFRRFGVAPLEALSGRRFARGALRPDKLFWVKTPEDQRLWAAEQSLKQKGVGAVLIWLPKVRPEALRRLQVAGTSLAGARVPVQARRRARNRRPRRCA